MRYIMILAIVVMLSGCAGVGNIAKYTVCFGEEPEPCFAGYIEIAGPTLQGIK